VYAFSLLLPAAACAALCAVLQVAQLQAEVSSKQAQLQALSLEHMALAAKARALDQLLASAGGWCYVLCIGGAQGGWGVGACVCTGPAAGLSR
jgi:hypothetical protein